jgi:hypothetical protein
MKAASFLKPVSSFDRIFSISFLPTGSELAIAPAMVDPLDVHLV